jgi:alpha 1,6-mannosyltransferase
VGDVVVLPVTGFSPGGGNFGAGDVDDPQAMVQHLFRGSWKEEEEKEGEEGEEGPWTWAEGFGPQE